MREITVRARSLSPVRSSKPITGNASHTTGTERLSTNALRLEMAFHITLDDNLVSSDLGANLRLFFEN